MTPNRDQAIEAASAQIRPHLRDAQMEGWAEHLAAHVVDSLLALPDPVREENQALKREILAVIGSASTVRSARKTAQQFLALEVVRDAAKQVLKEVDMDGWWQAGGAFQAMLRLRAALEGSEA